jgi:hypothetical protein
MGLSAYSSYLGQGKDILDWSLFPVACSLAGSTLLLSNLTMEPEASVR